MSMMFKVFETGWSTSTTSTSLLFPFFFSLLFPSSHHDPPSPREGSRGRRGNLLRYTCTIRMFSSINFETVLSFSFVPVRIKLSCGGDSLCCCSAHPKTEQNSAHLHTIRLVSVGLSDVTLLGSSLRCIAPGDQIKLSILHDQTCVPRTICCSMGCGLTLPSVQLRCL